MFWFKCINCSISLRSQVVYEVKQTYLSFHVCIFNKHLNVRPQFLPYREHNRFQLKSAKTARYYYYNKRK
jgi:hypothetical protein